MRSYARSRTPCRRGELTSTSEAAVGGSGVGDDEDNVLSLAWGAADSLGAGDCVAVLARLKMVGQRTGRTVKSSPLNSGRRDVESWRNVTSPRTQRSSAGVK